MESFVKNSINRPTWDTNSKKMKSIKPITPIWGITLTTTLLVVIMLAFTGCKEEDDFVAVSSISGVPTVALVNTPLTLSATVSPNNATNKIVEWTVKNAGTTGASITSGNTLTSAAAGTVTVTATIANGASKNTPFSSDFTISVNTVFTVTGVTVTPETSDVPKGYALDFKATVTGDKLTDADKTVTWQVTGGTKSETTISADGILVISSDETAETLTITATSVADNSKSGTATVRVYELKPSPHDNNFEDAEIVEIEFMGEKRLCYYIDGKYIIEGDIIIKDDNSYELEINSKGNISVKAAMVTSDDKYVIGTKWDEGKVYYFRDNIEDSWIRYAMNSISDATNQKIKFIELTAKAQIYMRDYKKNTLIRIKFDEKISSSPVGMYENEYKTLYLKQGLDAMHELCHTLGLIHEHSRPDRDTYIVVHKDRLKEEDPDSDINYRIWGIEANMLYKSEFDYGSIMMYWSYNASRKESYVFGIDRFLPTMTRKENGKDTGKPVKDADTYELTTLDKQYLNKLYTQRNATPDVFIHPNNGNNVKPTSNSCVLTGEVIYEGYPVMSEYGICYREKGTTSLIRVKATKPENVVTYECALTNLKPNTTYEYGIYFIYNNDFYGNPRLEFTTLPGTKIAEPEMVFVQGGTFIMGCTSEQGGDCVSNEMPVHQVTLSSYYIGKYEVTEGQWKAVMGSNPSNVARGDNYPVDNVSWNMIVGTTGSSMVINGITYYSDGFIYKLNQMTGKRYRLPTEAERQYAARGGNQSKGYKYSGSNTIGNVAWYMDNSIWKHEVGTKLPNELGIYDMSGNVYEWCSDWLGNYSSSAQTNPQGPSSGSYRVNSGGSWNSDSFGCCVSRRGSYEPSYRSNVVGFRVVLPI